MGQALYRKYRSKSFDEVIGQDHVTKTLKNAIKSGKISHAYLLTGPKGVGKTSVARILAHEVNGIPYDDDSIHLDIIEIDAASNRRIDEIRSLRERVHIAPTSAKYKVYIIDEVHMLTKEAFNALLKTLEEPPAHCIFILATTELHKLPETIISRTQRFTFKPFETEEAVKHLGAIAKSEKVDITPGALEMLAEHGEGSFRDSISMLDQLAASGQKIDEQQVLDMLGMPSGEGIDKLLQSIENGDTKAVLAGLDDLRGQGVDAAAIAKSVAKKLRSAALSGTIDTQTPALLKDLLAVPASPEPADYLEIALLEAASNYAPVSTPIAKEAQLIVAEPESEPPVDDIPLAEEPAPAAVASSPKSGEFKLSDWGSIVERAKAEAGTLYSSLRLARPELEDDTLKLYFKFPLHQKKLTQSGNANLLGKIIEEVSGAKLKIESIVDKSAAVEVPKPIKKTSAKNESQPDSSLNSISNIFGSAEVLES